MRVTVRPGGSVGGEVRVPGDKSIAHRWLILAATAQGSSELRGLPPALDVRSTAKVLAAISGEPAQVPLETWASEPRVGDEGDGSTTNKPEPRPASVHLRAEGRGSLHPPGVTLDCGNSGTTMRLLAGVLASTPFASVLTGDESLLERPMERIAAPLRSMGADVTTHDGRAPVEITGGPLHAIRHRPPVPSAQVKGAVLLAGIAAVGETVVEELAPTRDHTERALAHLGVPVRISGSTVAVTPFEHEGFAAAVPGDVSSALFLVAAAALTGAELVVRDVGLNPSRLHLLEVLVRMGVPTRTHVEREELGEPIGSLEVAPLAELVGTTVEEAELPLLIDEVPALALLAAHARGDTVFHGASELRWKESDRLTGLERAIRALGGDAGVEGEDLVVAGGGLRGGLADAGGDHRMAMALAVAALAAGGPVEIEGIEAAEVSFPGFLEVLRALGAEVTA